MRKPWEAGEPREVDPKYTEIADRIDALNPDQSSLVAKVVKGLREGDGDSVKILYWNEMDKFRGFPEVAEIIEKEIIGDEEVRKTLRRGAGEFRKRK
ncbi:MAG: hypothetical protein Q8P82_03410 [bacterium]|nr:hypothetical protein [bacterium]